MNRITISNLEGLVRRINIAAGTPQAPYTKEGGSFRVNVGNYHLDSAYGGWKLAQTVNEHGGERNITEGYVSKRELWGQLQAFLRGLEARS